MMTLFGVLVLNSWMENLSGCTGRLCASNFVARICVRASKLTSELMAAATPQWMS